MLKFMTLSREYYDWLNGVNHSYFNISMSRYHFNESVGSIKGSNILSGQQSILFKNIVSILLHSRGSSSWTER